MTNLLYELLPIRPVDLFHLLTYLKENTLTFLVFVVESCFEILLFAFLFARKLQYKYWIYLSAFFAGLAVFVYIDYLHLYVILCITIAMFTNFEKRQEGELSAYNVFNKNFERLMGTLTQEQIDRQLRHQPVQ
jgi:hypothetical protein